MHEEILSGILEELKKLNQVKTLGFVDPPHIRRLHCNSQYMKPHSAQGALYFWNGGTKEAELLPHTAICFNLGSIDVERGDFKGKDKSKGLFLIQADQPYKLTMGLDTLVLKSFLLFLQSADPSTPLTLVLHGGGDDGSLLFCSVWQNGTKLARSDRRLDEMTTEEVLAILQQLQAKFGTTPPASTASMESSEIAPVGEPVEDLGQLIAAIDVAMQQCHWTPAKGRSYLLWKYQKRSRSQLTTEELVNFLEYLKTVSQGYADDFEYQEAS